MMFPRLRLVLPRVGFSIFVLLTSIYCVLAYIPFTYEQIHVAGLLPWLTTFVKIHSYLYWLFLAALIPALMPDLRRPETKTLVYGFLAFIVVVGIWLLWRPLLIGLRNDFRSFVWAMGSLVPLAWLAAIDWLAAGTGLRWKRSESVEDVRIFEASWKTAVFSTFVYACIFYLRRSNGQAHFLPREGFASLVWSLASHLLMFMAVFLALFFLRGLAGFFRQAKLEFFLYVATTGIFIGTIVELLVFRQISFSGSAAMAYSLTFGFCSAAALAAVALRLYPQERTVDSGMALLITPFRWSGLLKGVTGLIPLAGIAVLAYLLEARAARLDWNYLLQKLTVVLIWCLAFANFYDLSARRERRQEMSAAKAGALLLVALAALGVYKALALWQAEFPQPESRRKLNISELLDAYGAYDVSFKLADETLSPPRSQNSSFYRFLSHNTNIPRSIPTHPADVNLVEHLTPTNLPKPDIFIFVIDSLRRDYLSPYNPDVDFTPSIEAFGRESVVMQNAFTHYGGTGLSEPSIWVGGLLLHQQYVTPFYPMNALAKLLQIDGYRSLVSKDAILSTIVPPSPSTLELDEGTTEKDLDFCRSLANLENKLGAGHDPSAPLFAYTQPQNIHISVIHREGESVPAGETYPRFYAPYASRLKRMDACFGHFIDVLKQKNRYDNAIIILTSDHGDSLGEGGRWGHAYTLFPEIVKIPLIFHLPPAMRTALAVDPRTLAFETDITPTLYYLLGHRPIVRSELFGRPLFMEKPGEEAPYVRDSYLMASSYGSVYGVLSGRGQTLYVTDGVNYRDYLFDLTDSIGMSRRVSAAVREENQKIIHDDVTAIGHFYRFE